MDGGGSAIPQPRHAAPGARSPGLLLLGMPATSLARRRQAPAAWWQPGVPTVCERKKPQASRMTAFGVVSKMTASAWTRRSSSSPDRTETISSSPAPAWPAAAVRA